VGRHAAVALLSDRNGERDEFFGLRIECAVTEGRAGKGAVAVEHSGDVVVQILHGLAELVEDRFVGHGNLLLGSGM
jgi:hypothetical protein